MNEMGRGVVQDFFLNNFVLCLPTFTLNTLKGSFYIWAM